MIICQLLCKWLNKYEKNSIRIIILILVLLSIFLSRYIGSISLIIIYKAGKKLDTLVLIYLDLLLLFQLLYLLLCTQMAIILV